MSAHPMNPAHLIPALVWTDDHGAKAAFDAAPWFAQASAAEIKDLAECGWRGDYPADAVAEWLRDATPAINGVLEHAEEQTEAGEECGFECAVNEDEARDWLAAHRPEVWAVIQGITAS